MYEEVRKEGRNGGKGRKEGPYLHLVKKACFSYLSQPGADDCEVEPRKGTLLDMEGALARGVSAGAGAEA